LFSYRYFILSNSTVADIELFDKSDDPSAFDVLDLIDSQLQFALLQHKLNYISHCFSLKQSRSKIITLLIGFGAIQLICTYVAIASTNWWIIVPVFILLSSALYEPLRRIQISKEIYLQGRRKQR
jgi:hypothetical protein